MLSFAAFTPHPPIIIPKIGEDNIKHCQATIKAMKLLAEKIEDKDIDTVIFISPHTTLSPNSMMVSYNDEARGDFAQFEHPEISFRSKIDIELAEEIIKQGKKAKLKVQPLTHQDSFLIDHGVLVPLYYLKPELPSSCRIIIIGFSAASRADHFAFGQTIREVAEKSDESIAIIASGDLSHRIFDYGAEMIGKKFDQELVENINKYDPKKIMSINPDLQEEAGECGYRSLLIALGATDGLPVKPEVLSYEAPFGVGYMVANFNINN